MKLRPYQEKLKTPIGSTGSYSLGISKKIPEGSANLAFAVSPNIEQDSISIANEFSNISSSSSTLGDNMYFADDTYLLKNKSGVPGVPTRSVLISDEFSLRKNILDSKTNNIIGIAEPTPLYYIATLKYPIKIDKSTLLNCIPYVYGYDNRTVEQVKMDSQRSKNSDINFGDITPISNSLFTIMDDDGNIVHKGFKIRMSKDSSSEDESYQVKIYNSFDRDKTYKVKYIAYNGKEIIEIIKSNILFKQLPDIEAVKEFVSLELDPEDPNKEKLMSKVYAVEQDNVNYNIYSPTELYTIGDELREPFEFKYKIVANINMQYSATNNKMINAGIVYLNNNISFDIKGIIKAFTNEIGKTIPDYISFINPHPPAKYHKRIEELEDSKEYFDSNEYWELDLSSPQHHINDYDVIFIAGYGTHSMSTYNQVLKDYLLQGGRVVIDSASNDTLGVLNIDFGEDDPIIEYSYEYGSDGPILVNEAREFSEDTGVNKRHYNLDDSHANKIGYIETDSTLTRPLMTLSSRNDWTDIVRYKSKGNKVAVGCKSYKNRGKIYLSNCGLLKAFALNSNETSKKFLTNMVLTLVEDIWVSTPWSYDRLYHVDQLFDDEIDSLKYVHDIGVHNNIIAKKILAPSVKSLISKYVDSRLYKFEGKYYVEAMELREKTKSTGKEWLPSTRIHLSGTGLNGLKATDKVWAYASVPKPGFNINDKQGFSKSDIKVYNEDVPFTFTVRPYTYIWRNRVIKEFLPEDGKTLSIGEYFNKASLLVTKKLIDGKIIQLSEVSHDYAIDSNSREILLAKQIEEGEVIEIEYSNGKIYREKLYATGSYTNRISSVISRGMGLKPVALLSDIIPRVPGGSSWADKKNIFFEIRMGYYEYGIFNEDEHRVNLRIYDKLTGEYKYSSAGENIISYNDLFGYRLVSRGDKAREMRRVADDIIVQASTNHYIITANKRTFAIRQVNKDKIELAMPLNLNTNENWHPRIRNINVKKNNFDKIDYDRWLKTLGFKFEKEYITQRMLEYFGEVNEVEREKYIVTNVALKLLKDNLIETRPFTVETYDETNMIYSLVNEEQYEVDYADGSIHFSDILGEIFVSYTFSDFTHSELEEDTVLSIISRLSDDGSGLSDKDKEIISGAFDFIEQDLTLEYSLEEYNNQPWNPIKPLKKSTSEVAKFIDTKTIQVQYPNIHINSDILDNKIKRESLERMSTNLFKSINLNWLSSEPVALEYYDEMASDWILIEPKYYEIDFEQGLINISSETDKGEQIVKNIIHASYSYSTIDIQRKTYINAKSIMEELTKLDSYHYKIMHKNILSFNSFEDSDREGYEVPKLYIKENFEEPKLIEDPTTYEIDYRRGFVKLNFQSSGRIYMTYSYTKAESLNVEDYNRSSSTIELKENITLNDNIFVTYFYEDDFYEYKGYRDGERYIYLDLNPTRGHSCTVMTVKDGIVGYAERPTHELLGQAVYFYLMPSKIIKDGEVITENKTTVRHTFDRDTLTLLQLAHPELIMLGSIKITNNYTVHDLDILDTRLRGGGLKENISTQKIDEVDKLSHNFWDIVDFDGLQYFANGITIVRLPEDLLIENGGHFTTNDIRDIVEKHLAYGVLPIINYYKRK